MWRRWLIFTVVGPVLAFANTGCLFGGADLFVADAVVQVAATTAMPGGLAYVRFKYDVRDGRLRFKGHYRDPHGVSTQTLTIGRPGVFMRFQGIAKLPDGTPLNSPTAGTGITPCMGLVANYIVEDPDREDDRDIIDMNGNPLMPNEGHVIVDACDNNRDDTMTPGDTLDVQVVDGPHETYNASGVVVDGKFECKSPDPCSPPV